MPADRAQPFFALRFLLGTVTLRQLLFFPFLPCRLLPCCFLPRRFQLVLRLARRFKLRLPGLFLPDGFPVRSLGPFQLPPRGVLARLFVLFSPLLPQRLATQVFLSGKLTALGRHPGSFIPRRLVNARSFLPQLRLASRLQLRLPHRLKLCRFQLRLPCLFLPDELLALGVPSRSVRAFLLLFRLLLSQCLPAQVLLPGKRQALGLDSGGFVPCYLLSICSVVP